MELSLKWTNFVELVVAWFALSCGILLCLFPGARQWPHGWQKWLFPLGILALESFAFLVIDYQMSHDVQRPKG